MRGHMLIDVPFAAAAVSLYPVYGLLPLAWLAGAATAIHTWGVINPRSSLYLPIWWRLPAGTADLALTFDDGPNPETTPRVLDLLAQHGQHATFFLVGEHVARHPALVRRMVDEGHAVGLHSHGHSRLFNCWPPGNVRRDLEACGKAIADATGQPPPTLFRPPVGLKNPVVGFVAGRLGLRAVTWSHRALDTGTASVDQVIARLKPGLTPRSILVMHDGYEPTRPRERSLCVASLERLLPLLATSGLRSHALAVAPRGIALRPPSAGR
jgi:peptidoglycan-N-acetylglucosamine deacetylase